MKRNYTLALLIGICIFSAVLRLYKLGANPASMNADEAAIGYNAYSILKTGRDEYGKKLPLLFRSFDDYKLPAYVYLTVPSVAVLGLNDLSVRLPSAIFGILTIPAAYFLVAGLFSNVPVALITAALLAISPWHLQFSRSAYEANVAVFFLVAGMALLVHALRKPRLYTAGFLFLAASVWSYHSSRIFIPLLLVCFGVIFFQSVRKQSIPFIVGLLILCISTLPLYILSFSSTGLVRARGVSALDDASKTARNVSWRVTDITESIPFSNVYHNQRFVNISILLKGYLDHLSPNFFFSEVVQAKYHAPGVGLLYIWELPVLLYGLYVLGRMKNKEKWLVASWLLLAPIAAAPTQMLPHPVRTLIFLPSLQICIAVGLWELYEVYIRKARFRKALLSTGIALILIQFSFYLHQYYVHAPVEYAKDWQYGHEQVVRSVASMKDKFDTVIVSTSLDEPYMFFLYYLKYDPARYLAQGGTVSGKFDEERNEFDTYQFHTFVKSGEPLNPRVLYVGSPSEVLPGAEKLVTIAYPTGEKAYVISAEISKKNWNDSGYLPHLD